MKNRNEAIEELDDFVAPGSVKEAVLRKLAALMAIWLV
jgi:hypothetical protein